MFNMYLHHHVGGHLGAGAVQVEPGVDDLVHQVKGLEAAVVDRVTSSRVLLCVCPEITRTYS